jgi:hypothetical protein
MYFWNQFLARSKTYIKMKHYIIIIFLFLVTTSLAWLALLSLYLGFLPSDELMYDYIRLSIKGEGEIPCTIAIVSTFASVLFLTAIGFVYLLIRHCKSPHKFP